MDFQRFLIRDAKRRAAPPRSTSWASFVQRVRSAHRSAPAHPDPHLALTHFPRPAPYQDHQPDGLCEKSEFVESDARAPTRGKVSYDAQKDD